MDIGKIPPNDIEAEQAVLGSMLTDKDAVINAIEVLKEEDFYREDNKIIYRAILNLYNRAEPIDIITLKSELTSMGKFEATGGLEYLAELPEMVPTTANVDRYIKIVEEKSILRNLIKTANEIITLGYDPTEEVENTDKKTNKALKITGIICIAIVVLALIFIFVITSFKNKEIKVPEKLLGATEKKACQKIEKAGLICKVEYDYDEEKDEDQVLKVKPKSGSKLKKGATVTITVSSFDGTVLVENYVGKNIKTIQQKLEKKGIIVSTLEKSVTKKDNIAANTIVEQSVKKGERLEKGDTIELTYAVLVEAYPDFTDGSYTKVKVQQFCEDNKITCNFTDQETKTYETGTILSQSRAAGDEIKEGQSITITVAKKIEEPKVEPKQEEKQNTQTDTTKTDNKEEDKEA